MLARSCENTPPELAVVHTWSCQAVFFTNGPPLQSSALALDEAGREIDSWRDASFGKGFVARAGAIGIETLLSPFRCPQANGIAERMVGTFRRQCLDHVIVLNERHLKRLVTEYVEHYNGCTPHRALEPRAPEPRPRMLKPPDGGRVVGRPVLGGLHHEYSWEAA